MADSPLSRVNPRSFTVPIMLVGALAAGALVPHFGPKDTSATAAARAPSPSASSTPAGALPIDEQDPTLPVLADYFGVDITTAALRRRTLAAAAHLTDHDGLSYDDASILRGFFCIDLRWKADADERKRALNGIRAIQWAQTLTDTSQPPGCDGGGSKHALDAVTAETLQREIVRYFNDDANHDDAVTMRAVAAGTSGFVDEAKLRAKDFDTVNKAPLQWTIVERAAARHQVSLEFLIATVPDPIDSYETWQFDPNVDAIRQGIQDAGFLFDRYHLPGIDERTGTPKADTSRDRHEHSPGVILFRRKTSEVTQVDSRAVLVLFLVPENPVAGIHAEPFMRSMEFVSGWMNRHSVENRIRILGPSFSGATPSLARALLDFNRILAERGVDKMAVTIVSGSATADFNRKLLENNLLAPHLDVTFRATVHSNAAIDCGLRSFLAENGVAPDDRIAALSEASTGYGTAGEQFWDSGDYIHTSPCDARAPLSIKYPFNIAQLRNDVSHDGYPRREQQVAPLIPGFRPLSLEDLSPPTDQLPVRSPKTTSASVELALDNLLDIIRHEHIRVANIDATDVRDKLFLIRKLRERAPDTLIVTSDTDLFQAHPDQAEWLKGVIVASTYPLHPISQRYVFPYPATSSGTFVQFPSLNSQGIYNAALALLAYGPTDHQNSSAPLPSRAGSAALLDYTGPSCGADGNGGYEPAVWISLVGSAQIVPLRAYCNLEKSLSFRDSQPDVDSDSAAASFQYVFRPRMVGPKPKERKDSLVSPAVLPLLLILVPGGLLSLITVTPVVRHWLLSTKSAGAQNSPNTVVPAMALSGVMIHAAFLGAMFVVAGHMQAIRSAYAWLIGTVCLLEIGVAVWLQWRSGSRRHVWLWAYSAVTAVLFAAYAVYQTSSAPELFVERALDLASQVSPLAVVAVCGLVPMLFAFVEQRRLRVYGDSAQTTGEWNNSLDAFGKFCAGATDQLLLPLRNGHSTLFALTRSWYSEEAVVRFWLPLLTGILAYVAMFRVSAPTAPLLTAEGWRFGWAVLLVVLLLQFAFASAIAQFAYYSRKTHRFLECVAQSLDDLPYGDVAPDLSKMSPFPTPPGLRHLSPLARQASTTRDELTQDLKSTGHRRWFETKTWNLFRAHLTSDDTKTPFSRQLEALSVALVVRELLSRLSLYLLLAGPAIVLLIALQLTFYFERSHRLLALIWVDVAVGTMVAVWALVKEDRDTLISKLRGSEPGEIDMNWDFIMKLLLYIALPLVTLFITQFPNVAGGLSGLLQALQPIQRLPGS